MASDPLDALRLSLMQDVLPVGLAAVDRVRRGGPGELWSAFAGDPEGGDPLERLREEGEPAASRLRQQLDQVSPGLGNPVMKVQVRDVGEAPAAESPPPAADRALLQQRLKAMDARLRLLEQRLLESVEHP
jgi:hypothetical protein